MDYFILQINNNNAVQKGGVEKEIAYYSIKILFSSIYILVL